jgi:hypothetical protein
MLGGVDRSGNPSGMRTRRTTILTSLIAAVAIAAAGSLAAAATPAHAHYLNTHTDNRPNNDHLNLLRLPRPANPRFRPCIHRTVRIRAGTYVHGGYLVSVRHRTDPDLVEQPLTIRFAGRYSWEACRGWNRHARRYEVRSTLRGPRGRVVQSNLNPIEPDFGPGTLEPESHVKYGTGIYEWGGRIARTCSGCTSPQG